MATLLDGKKTAMEVRDEVADRVERLAKAGHTPGLAVVQVGDDPASTVYVRNKRKMCERLGIRSFAHDLPDDATEHDVLEVVDELNRDRFVHGILVQLPLPSHIRSGVVLESLAPHKDVDGFHPYNAGRLLIGRPSFVPCTPMGIMWMLRRYEVPTVGKRAVVIGRSNIVGKPTALLLLQAHATVTVAHSRTRDLPALVRSADIVVAAVGKAEMVRGDWIAEGAAVIDVGIQRGEDGKLTGDVAFEEAAERARFISPVPGGVGPMTIAMLMHNTALAAERIAGLA